MPGVTGLCGFIDSRDKSVVFKATGYVFSRNLTNLFKQCEICENKLKSEKKMLSANQNKDLCSPCPLKGKIALVTGSCNNFGKEMATSLARAGARVIITSRRESKVRQAVQELYEQNGLNFIPEVLELTNENSIIKLFSSIKANFDSLDILVNNAGGHSPEACGYLEKETLAGWDAFIEPNLTGSFLMMREYARLMMPQKKGNIINIASISSLVGRDRSVYSGNMTPNPVAYTAAKAGLIGLTYDVAAYLGEYNIRVNCISPGGFERNQPREFIKAYSDRTMLKRMGRHGDLGDVVAFLASEAASYITGHNLVVDGGFTTFK